MDPSYNNSFGGNNLGANPTPLPPSDQGDIILTPTPGSNKKPKTALIILAVFIIIALFAGIAYLILNRGSGGQVSQNDLKESFNSYANYVLYGKESTENLTEIPDAGFAPYFEELNSDERTQYVAAATEKYDKFTSLYYAEGRDTDDLTDTNPLQDYFQDYPRVKFLDEEDVLNLYNKYGKSEATQMIKNNYNITDVSNNMAVYIDDSEKLSDTYLEIVSNIDSAGCLKEGAVIEGCYVQTEKETLSLQITFDIIDMKNSFYTRAAEALENIYEELY